MIVFHLKLESKSELIKTAYKNALKQKHTQNQSVELHRYAKIAKIKCASINRFY